MAGTRLEGRPVDALEHHGVELIRSIIKRAKGSPAGTSGSTSSSGISTTAPWWWCSAVVVVAGGGVVAVQIVTAFGQNDDEFVGGSSLGARIDEIGDEQLIDEEQGDQQSRPRGGPVRRSPDIWIASPLSPIRLPRAGWKPEVTDRSTGAPLLDKRRHPLPGILGQSDRGQAGLEVFKGGIASRPARVLNASRPSIITAGLLAARPLDDLVDDRSSSDLATTRDTAPSRRASSGLMIRPVIISSRTALAGMARSSGTVIIIGHRPTSISGVPSLASSTQIVMSQATASPNPPARAWPFTRATVGLPPRHMARKRSARTPRSR